MCQSLCPPERPWHHAGAFPAGRAPPFGSPCRHFVDARGGQRLLWALPHFEPVAMLSSCLLSVPRYPGRDGGAIRACTCHRGLRLPSRPEWLLGDHAAWPGPVQPGVSYGRTRPSPAWGHGSTMGMGENPPLSWGVDRDHAMRGWVENIPISAAEKSCYPSVQVPSPAL